jgi:hypothetical protein
LAASFNAGMNYNLNSSQNRFPWFALSSTNPCTYVYELVNIDL